MKKKIVKAIEKIIKLLLLVFVGPAIVKLLIFIMAIELFKDE